jgi:hypothetical protein
MSHPCKRNGVALTVTPAHSFLHSPDATATTNSGAFPTPASGKYPQILVLRRPLDLQPWTSMFALPVPAPVVDPITSPPPNILVNADLMPHIADFGLFACSLLSLVCLMPNCPTPSDMTTMRWRPVVRSRCRSGACSPSTWRGGYGTFQRIRVRCEGGELDAPNSSPPPLLRRRCWPRFTVALA